MKFAMIAAGATLSAAALAAPAQAQHTGFTAGAGYTHFDGDDVAVGGLTGRLGYRFFPYFGVEGEAAIGVNDDAIGGVDVELDHAFGVYGVGYLPVSENVELFGRAGWAEVEARASLGAFTVGADEDGLGFGGGAVIAVSERLAFRGEYTRLEGDDDALDTFSFGAQVSF